MATGLGTDEGARIISRPAGGNNADTGLPFAFPIAYGAEAARERIIPAPQAACSPDSLLNRLREFLLLLAQQPLGKELWIVEPGRVRIHQPDIDAA
jgi:hypothetical protein